MKILSPVDFQKIQAKNFRVENLESHPPNPKPGMMYFNFREAKYYGFTGLEWISLSTDVSFPVSDESFAVKNKDDATKQVKFDLSRLASNKTVNVRFPKTDNVELPKTDYHAQTDPTPNHDVTLGFDVGSRWINESYGREYVCVRSNKGIALWIETTKRSFSQLEDTPTTYHGEKGKVATVKESEDGLEFKGVFDLLGATGADFLKLRGYKTTLRDIPSQEIVHNLQTKNIVYKLFDRDGHEMWPGEFRCLDENTAYVEMNPPVPCFLTIIGIEN